MLQGKKVLIGITGSIAAYKAILLVRLLVKGGAEVKVIITPAAKSFVSALTLATLSKNKVLSDLFEEDTWANHVMLGRWADVMLIAPLSCNTLAKMANGLCDNLLLATYLSATCPVVVAPAMDEDMWLHPSTKRNLATLSAFGNKIINVENGALASGLYGEGRMAEPKDIILYLKENVFREKKLDGKYAIVTAGPTFEAIDPVRFIGNHSSGKMGIAIANALYEQGASVTIILGPTTETIQYKGIKVINVVSANKMFDASMQHFSIANIAVMAAAVADFTIESASSSKLKKEQHKEFSLNLVTTTDILKSIGGAKRTDQFVVGFALETNNERENAIKKLTEKNADLIILNSMNDADAGFGKDTNKITAFHKSGREIGFEAKSKALVAKDIVQIIIENIT